VTDPSLPERFPWLFRFSVSQYQRLREVGAITPEDRVELVEGIGLIQPILGPDHCAAVDHFRWAVPQLPPGWRLYSQPQVVLADSRLEPEFGLVAASPATITPADVGIVVDVASSLPMRDYCQRDKARIYARGNVVCYWIVNLQENRVEVHTQPSGPCASPAYASVVNSAPGDSVPLVLDGATVATIPVTELLP
jgi:hypothetical protein